MAPVSIVPIRLYPDAVLKRKAEPVTRFDAALQQLIDVMFETMYAAPGVGLAAPQIGESLRLFVYDVGAAEGRPGPGVVINPHILSQSGQLIEEEGCLSVDGYRDRVRRAGRMAVVGLDRDGKEIRLEGEGLFARMLQHEMDHLDGLVFIDRLSPLKRGLYLKKLKKQARTDPHHRHDHD